MVVGMLFIFDKDTLFNSKGDESKPASVYGFLSSLNLSAFFCDCDDLFSIYINERKDGNAKMQEDIRASA